MSIAPKRKRKRKSKKWDPRVYHPEGPTKIYSFTLPEALMISARKMADEEGITLSKFVTAAVRNAVS